MADFLNRQIKEILRDYPETAIVLAEYQIECVTCEMGLCRIKDLMEIHNLNEIDQEDVLKRIAGILYPGIDIKISKIKTAMEKKRDAFSPLTQQLVDEHIVIKRFVHLIPEIISVLDTVSIRGMQIAAAATDFIVNYIDKFHHGKEEGILFNNFNETPDIIKIMHRDYNAGRTYVEAMLRGIENSDVSVISENLISYGEFITEHMYKEDKILFPWINRKLPVHLNGELLEKFDQFDEKFRGIRDKYEDLLKDTGSFLDVTCSKTKNRLRNG